MTSDQNRLLAAIQQGLQTGQAARVLPWARQLASQLPQHPDAQQLLGLCCAQTGAMAEAETAFLKALQLAPDHPLLLANLATLLAMTDRRPQALVCWRKVVQAQPAQARAWRTLGLLALDEGLPPEGLAALQRAVALEPGDATAWHGLGSARRLVDDLGGAEQALRRSLALVAANATGWLSLGALHRLQGRPDEALQCYEQARIHGAERLPEWADAVSGALADLGRTAEAVQTARRLTQAHPQWPPGHVTLSELLWEHGAAVAPGEDPLAAFRAAVQAQPGHGALGLAWAGVLLKTRQTDEALAVLHSLRQQADQPLLAHLQAMALEQAGQHARAGALFAQTLAGWGEAAPAAFLNAYTRHLLQSGDVEQAALRATQATQRAPGDQEAWAYLGTAWRLQGDAREHWLCDWDRLVVRLPVQAPPQFADTGEFLTAVQTALTPLHQARQAPMQQSVRGGTQTSGRLFGGPNAALAAAQKALQQTAQAWLDSLPADPTHPFLARQRKQHRYAGSWSVRLWSSGHHVNHIHPEGWLSSAFYVALPPSVQAGGAADGQAGHLQFGVPPTELGLNLPPRRVLRPEPGWLALFPSYLWHGTQPFQDEQPRLTIAFDLLPTG